MKKRVALYGGAFNPPHIGHVATAELLARSGDFDEVIVMPCGPRPLEKSTVTILPSSCRATLCDLAFGKITGVKVDRSDLRNNIYTRTYAQVDAMPKGIETWVVIGSDLVSDVRNWEEGERLWNEVNFAIVQRTGSKNVSLSEVPIHSKIYFTGNDISSSKIRNMIFSHESITGLVPPAVEEYIFRYKLYSGRSPLNSGFMKIDTPRALMVVNENKSDAVWAAEQLKRFRDNANPNMVWVFGGDGTMFKAMRRWWHLRIPFVGFNFGTDGFLFGERNLAEEVIQGKYLFERIQVYRHPLLEVHLENAEGKKINSFAFNDAWIERQDGQMALIKILVNGDVIEDKLKCDLVLLTTPGGSTSYARVLGGTCMYLNSKSLMLMASGVHNPPHKRSWDLELEDRVELISLEPGNRPTRVFIDGVGFYDISRVDIFASQDAAVEIGFHPDYDISEKVRKIFDDKFDLFKN